VAGGVGRPLIVLGTPLFLALWMLFHPSPYDDFSGELMLIARWWIVLHAVQFVLFVFMGVAVWLLVDGLRGIAAAVFVVFYDAGDAIAGIVTGILVRNAANGVIGERAAEAMEAIFADPTKNLLFQEAFTAG
jgi:hypothetical protein